MKKANIEKGLGLIVEGVKIIGADAGINLETLFGAEVAEAGAKEVAVDGTDDRRAELEAMKYNDLKAEAKRVGAKAVGKAPQIIEAILEIESADDSDDDQEDDADNVEDNTDDNNEESEVDVEELEEFLGELEDKEVKEIANEMGVKTSRRKVANVIKDMLEDAEKLDATLEEMGYYEDEEDADSDSEEDGEDEGLTLEEAQELLEDLEDDDIKEIAKEMEIKTARRKVASITKDILADLEKLDEALEALGYYEDEDEDSDDDSDDDSEDGNDENDEVAEYLEGLDAEELADLCEEFELSTKGKKQALMDRLLDAVEAGDIDPEDLMAEGDEDSDDDDSEDGEEDGYTMEDVTEFLNDELDKSEVVDVANELEIKLTAKDKKSKGAVAKKILAGAEVEEIVEVLENLGYLGDEDEDGEDFEASEERLETEEKVEAEIRKQYKAKKLKDATIKKFVTKYYDGDPDFKAGKKDELLEQYIEIKVSLVDDEGDVADLEEPYTRDDADYCCGHELVEGDKEGDLYCEICGTTYGDDEE